MIGVVANSSERPVIREFFELFKTPWEFYVHGRQYEVLLCAGEQAVSESSATVVLIYAGGEIEWDRINGIKVLGGQASVKLPRGRHVPIYGRCVGFRDGNTTSNVGDPVLPLARTDGRTVVRIGYDLFGEIRTLFTAGQPPCHAGTPTLELHIALLREMIGNGGVGLIEIPPVPAGHSFIVCLSHDVDHASMVNHGVDPTILGFLYRGAVGSLRDAARGRRRWRAALQNLTAVLKWPLVYLGVCRDPWREFGRYLTLERPWRSSFYVIPFRNRPGKTQDSAAPRRRAAQYCAEDVAKEIRDLVKSGCEIGLHGIDAWLETASGHQEAAEIRRVVGIQEIGVRMHWLYMDAGSFARLEDAGFSYDSTVGYNETVGHRAGTLQAYRPLGVSKLIELPLHIMDTALFFPSHLNLSAEKAWERVCQIVDDAEELGGCVTVNWHDRSIAPERLWGDFYVRMLCEFEKRGAWFATAGEAVSWFRARRSVQMEGVNWQPDEGGVSPAITARPGPPGIQVRIHRRPDCVNVSSPVVR
jgi:hypothetical protein